MNGTVKWYDKVKKFGFILALDQEYFFHCSDIVSAGYRILNKKDRVTFDSERGPRGPRAVRVQKVSA